MSNPLSNPLISRDVRVAKDLLEGVPFWACAGETYGELDDDWSGIETALSWEHTDVDSPLNIEIFDVYHMLGIQLNENKNP